MGNLRSTLKPGDRGCLVAREMGNYANTQPKLNTDGGQLLQRTFGRLHARVVQEAHSRHSTLLEKTVDRELLQ